MLSPSTTQNAIVGDEVPREADRMGDAQRATLVAVGQVEAELVTIGQQLHDVADAAAAKDDHHLADAHLAQRLDRVIDHRPVVDRQQVLVRDTRQRSEARAVAAGEDQSLHDADELAEPRSRMAASSSVCAHVDAAIHEPRDPARILVLVVAA